jgi:hypothetical protein
MDFLLRRSIMNTAVTFALVTAAAVLTACNPPGNVKSANDYEPPAAPAVVHPFYDPYATYGQANAIWQPPVYDRNGTIVEPVEPATQAGRPDYEHAPWATGAAGRNILAPPGTF